MIGLPPLVLFAAALQPKEPRLHRLSMLLGAAAFAILPLIKGSTLQTVAFCAGGLAVVSLAHSKRLAVQLASIFIAVMSIAWISQGQQLLQLPRYFLAQLPIISGYTDAMSLQGEATDFLVFGLLAAAILLHLWTLNIRHAWLVLCAFAIYLFLCFKAGFVRHDKHVLTAAFAGVFATYALLLHHPSAKA